MDQMCSVLDQNTVSYSIKFVLILRLENQRQRRCVMFENVKHTNS